MDRVLGHSTEKCPGYSHASQVVATRDGEACARTSARAYAAELKRVAHTRVVHCKKRVKGKWVLPKYVEEVTLNLDGVDVTVKSGTQFVDGFWKHLKEELRYTSMVNMHGFDDYVRIAQWRYWIQGQDPWAALGRTLRSDQIIARM
eukprot:3918351-Amphidinium_carterae.1